MGRGNRAKQKKSEADKIKQAKEYLKERGLRMLSNKEMENIKDEVSEFVMKRAYVMVMSAFLDTGNTNWKDYFKSKKKMEEYCNECINQVELYGKWIERDKILHFDDIADYIYEKFGKDYRTAWLNSADKQAEMEFQAMKEREMLNTVRGRENE